jgi:hypothetical protein
MNKFRFTIQILAVAIFMFAFAAIAQAQATRTWVSGVGDDVNPCSRTAPCKTYAGAISKTAVNGEISTLDPGGFGAVTITKSITIEGTQGQGYGSILHSGVTGVSIAYDSFSGEALTQKTVRLRNLNINGSGGSGGSASSGLRAIRISGGANSDNSKVFIEDCVIDGSFGSPGRGIEDVRTGNNAHLIVSNTTIRNNGGSGIQVTGNNNTRVTISNSRISNCGGFGIAATGGARVVIFNSEISDNPAVGIQADGGSTIEVDHCVVSNNTTAGFAATNASTIRVSNTTAMNNNPLASIFAGGAVSSYGNNQTGGAAFPSAGTNQQ